MILSTCNRVEIYASTSGDAKKSIAALEDFLASNRQVQDRLAQLKGSLTGGAMSFSGSAFEGDVKALAAKGVEGIETEAVTLLLEKMYRAENDRLAQSLQQAFETQ